MHKCLPLDAIHSAVFAVVTGNWKDLAYGILIFS